MPLWTIFQLYRGGQFYWWKKPEYRRKPPTCHKLLYHIMLYRGYLVWVGFDLTTLVLIGTDCKDSCKSNYHTITTAPYHFLNILINTMRVNRFLFPVLYWSWGQSSLLRLSDYPLKCNKSLTGRDGLIMSTYTNK